MWHLDASVSTWTRGPRVSHNYADVCSPPLIY